MSERNKQLVRRAVETIWNHGEYAALGEFVASDFIMHASTPAAEFHGPEGIRQMFTELRHAFPDIHFAIEDQVAEGDRVVTRWTAQATHTGPFHGMPPTGKQATLSGIDIDRVANDKVVECWQQMDELGLLRQLGVIPTPEPTVRAADHIPA